MKIKIYVVNLKRDHEKKKIMKIKLSNILNIPYQFIEGCDGSLLDTTNMKYHVNTSFRNPYCYNSITMGEIGCSISHYQLWERAKSDLVDFAIILEDDCDLDNNFEYYINSILNKNQIEKYDLIYLGRKNFNDNEQLMIEDKENKYKLVKPNFSYWTIGYILSRNGIIKLLKSDFLNDIIPIDEFLPICYGESSTNYPCNVKIKALAIKPMIVKPQKNAFLKSRTESSKYYIYSFKNNFFDNKITLISVASHRLDGYKRFINSCHTYGFPYSILGLDQQWKGNNMRIGPGGGQKVNLMKKFLSNFDDNDDRLIVFSDCYDAVINNNPQNIYNKFVDNFACDILFSAEPMLWPDKSLENLFNIVDTPYRYLNSGGFIGSIKNLKVLINDHINDSEDDQLYYQKIYLKFQNDVNPKLKILLDTKCIIFQTLSSHLDTINIEFDKSIIKNDLTETEPCIIHGNGGINSKVFLSNLTNYISLKYRPCYGYKDLHTDISKFKKLNYYQYPTILFYLPIFEDKNINNITNILLFKYPFCNSKMIIANFSGLSDTLISQKYSELKTHINVEYVNCKIDKVLLKDIIMSRLDLNYDYIFFMNIDHVITYNKILQSLISSNLDIVSPLLLGKNNSIFSNFWGDIDYDGNYKRSFNYLDIITRKHLGYWNVPYLSGSILIGKNKYSEILNLMKNRDMVETNGDFDIYFCKILREHYNFLYVSNYDNYGYILDD